MTNDDNTMPDASTASTSSAPAITSVTASPLAPPVQPEPTTIEAPSHIWQSALISKASQFTGAGYEHDELSSAGMVSGIANIAPQFSTAPLYNSNNVTSLPTFATLSNSFSSPPTRAPALTSKFATGPYIHQAPLMTCFESGALSAHAHGNITSARNPYYNTAIQSSVNNFWGLRPTANSTFVQSLHEGYPYGGNIQRCLSTAQVQSPYALSKPPSQIFRRRQIYVCAAVRGEVEDTNERPLPSSSTILGQNSQALLLGNRGRASFLHMYIHFNYLPLYIFYIRSLLKSRVKFKYIWVEVCMNLSNH
ncbi:uncharacterized protein [Eurosta solidaginis]|uniref:uncharacterized protein n=1 Tax=Eurosta solidaginis TaxID=178769 RepID=UPI003531146A